MHRYDQEKFQELFVGEVALASLQKLKHGSTKAIGKFKGPVAASVYDMRTSTGFGVTLASMPMDIPF